MSQRENRRITGWFCEQMQATGIKVFTTRTKASTPIASTPLRAPHLGKIYLIIRIENDIMQVSNERTKTFNYLNFTSWNLQYDLFQYTGWNLSRTIIVRQTQQNFESVTTNQQGTVSLLFYKIRSNPSNDVGLRHRKTTQKPPCRLGL